MQSTNDLYLDKFLNVEWGNIQSDLLSGSVDLFPFLPLDLYMPPTLIDSVLNIIQKNCQYHGYYQESKVRAKNMSKFTLFGYKDYSEYWKASKQARDFQELERIMDDEPQWLIDDETVTDIISLIPAKKIYMIESRTAFSGGKSYLHWDREIMLHGMYNRLYIPLQWPKKSQLSFYGFGPINSKAGQVTVINGNQYLHGSHNDSDQDRHALMVIADLDTDAYRELVQRSLEKFLQGYHHGA